MSNRKTSRELARFLLAITLFLGNAGCVWHGVLKQNTAVGWGGRTIAVAVDPNDDNFVMAASPTGGLFQSASGGSSWSHVDALPAFGSFDVEFSPDHPNIIVFSAIEDSRVANGGGIWVSTDRGKSWSQPPSAIRRNASGAIEAHSAFGISFVPGTQRILVGTDAGLATSNDLGTTWTFIDLPSLPSKKVPVGAKRAPDEFYSVLALRNGRVITYGSAGIWMSDNGIDNWYPAANLAPAGTTRIANALAVAPLNPNDVFFTEDFETLRYSSDGGRNWSTASTSSTPGNIRQPTLRIAPKTASPDSFDIYWAKADGLNVKKVAIKSGVLDFSAPWIVNASSIAHSDPTDVAFSARQVVLYAANDGGVAKSDDAGKTWTYVGKASNGYDALQVYDVKVVLSDKSALENDVYFGTQDNNLYASGDDGQTWPGLVLPEGGRFQGPVSRTVDSYNQVHFNAQGPQRYGRLFDQTKYVAAPFGQAGQSDTVYFLSGNRFFAFSRDTGSGAGVWISLDGARSWSVVQGLNITQDIRSYAVVSGNLLNPSLIIPFWTGNSLALLRVDNAFDSIANNEAIGPIPLPTGASLGRYGFLFLNSLASFGVDPNDPNFIILPDIASGKIFITTDGGVSWVQRDDLVALITDGGTFKFTMPGTKRVKFELGQNQVSAIAFDPLNSNRILIGTAEAGIVYSSDHGATWNKIRGSDRVPNVTSFAFTQAQAPQTAFASSWGRGLWTISLDIQPRRQWAESQAAGAHTGPEPIGARREPIPGDNAEAQRRFSAVFPRLDVYVRGRWLPRNVVIVGSKIELLGNGWVPVSRGGSELQMTLDGQPVRATVQVDARGQFVSPIAQGIMPGVHMLEVRQTTSLGKQLATTLTFSAIADDEANSRTEPR